MFAHERVKISPTNHLYSDFGNECQSMNADSIYILTGDNRYLIDYNADLPKFTIFDLIK